MENQNNGVNTTGRILLIFQDEWRLDELCAALMQDGLPFSYASGSAISMPKQTFEQLSIQLRDMLNLHGEQPEVFTTAELIPTGLRRIPTSEEAREVLRQLTPKEFLPKP